VKRLRAGIRTFFSLISASVVVFTARASLADHYRVPSGSMEPTVHVGDRIIVSKLAYGVRVPMTTKWLMTFAPPARGDVVVLDPPDETATSDEFAAVLLKRVVALPGEVVEVRGGRVFIDDRALDDHWASFAFGGGSDFGPSRVPEGKVLLLGDNRGNSRDGRSFGFVDIRTILGRATYVVARDGHAALQPL
jgi:signal peptidase I